MAEKLYHLDLLNAAHYAYKRHGSKRASDELTRQLLWLSRHEVAIRLQNGRYLFC